MVKNKAAYIHIPFCEDICTYCDFCKFYYNESLVDKYLIALCQEIKSRYKQEVLNSIYIGGGTPSSLNIKQLEKLLNIIKQFNTEDLEYTIECNIENITEDKIRLFKEYGVNRISIGIQTFNKKYLKYLNRKHQNINIQEKINMIKKYITNINIDLIYAIKGETLEELNKDIDAFIAVDIPHISTYSLIIEDNTILGNKKEEYIDDNLDYNMYKLINKRLKEHGYNHYEISNFSKIGYESKHNLVYWNNEQYYGFGIGASGYIDNIRYTNTKSINHYLKGMYVYEKEELTFNSIIENEFILGFRKVNGINLNEFNNKYKINITNIDIVDELIKQNKLIIENNYLKINPKYLYVSNDILVEFIGVDYERYI